MSSHSVQTVKNGLKVLSGQIGINIFSLAFGIYFAHVLALREMAILAILVLISGLLSVTASLGMNDTLVKKIPAFIEEGKLHEVKSYFSAILFVQMVVATLLVCLTLSFYKEISILFYKSILPFSTMAIILSYAYVRGLLLIMDAMIRGVQRFGRLSTARVVEQVSSRLMSIALFFVWHVNGLLLGMLVGSIVCFLLYCYFLKEFIEFSKPSIKKMKEIISYSFPYYGAAWLRFSIMQSDRYFVSIFFQPDQLAVYHVATKIIEYFIQFIDALSAPITSKIAQLKVYGKERMESIFVKTIKYYFLLYIPVIGLLIAFARPAIELYGGAKYSNGFLIMIILAVGLMLAPFSSLIEAFIFILGEPLERLKIRFLSGVFSIIGTYELMKMLSVNGLALSKLFVWGIYIVVGAVLLRKFIVVRIDIKTLFKTIGLCLPIVAIGIVIQFFMYSYLTVALYFLIFISIVGFFYINVLKSDRGLLEVLTTKRFRGIAFLNKL